VQTRDKRFVNRMQKHDQDKYLATVIKSVPDAHEKYERVEVALEPIRLLQKKKAQQQKLRETAAIQDAAVNDDVPINQE